MKTVLNYFALPIDNSALSLRTANGRKEVVRATVHAVIALFIVCFILLCVDAATGGPITAMDGFSAVMNGIRAVMDGITFIVAVPLFILSAALLFVLLVPFITILGGFGIFSIFSARD